MNAETTLSQIKDRLGFVPPFFGPAVEHPAILENLWFQTQHTYLDNPLPALFKEKLAALLGRYCEVPYCLVCHTCTLRPLGMQGPEILTLLRKEFPTNEQMRATRDRLNASGEVLVPGRDAATDQDLFDLSSAIYSAGSVASDAREVLRRRLSAGDYKNLILFISYNRMCHEWMAAHPDISFELDQRYLNNHETLRQQAPQLSEFFAVLDAAPLPPLRPELDASLSDRFAARVAEVDQAVQISELRFREVMGSLREQMTQAEQNATEKEQLIDDLRRTSSFAQELVAIVSHDLRNPLNAIMMGTHLAMTMASGVPRIAQPLQRVLTSAKRAERLIYDLLDFSQARAGGGLLVRLQPMDLRAVLQQSVEEMQLAHPDVPIALEAAGELQGDWDADRLTQVVGNLLGNSIAHGRQGQPILVKVQGHEDQVRFEVTNQNRQGAIPQELLPVLFEPFKRGVPRAASRNRSVGLGLYIVAQIIRAHRGAIAVDSTDERTTFAVTLPRLASSPAIA